ncbi:hypothetical protein [Plastoroseomonas arctica]|uniref:Uncharacterized protein n=1 Tax=Plastoroseomonas arctica TaxID=1509237 RepID=A0AAF1JWX7_9PROT|nr:hypothetical protein [Plastoroseomonas arctica]MBR0653649.1 hypothetical protein [Plastoroseomonas arctica]
MVETAKNTRAEAPAREGSEGSVPFTILGLTALPDTRRTPLAAARVRLGPAEVVFHLAARRGQRWVVTPPRDPDNQPALFLPERIEEALHAAIIEAANADPVVTAHLAKRAWC